MSNAAPKTDPSRAAGPGFPRITAATARDKGQSPFGPGPGYGTGAAGIGIGPGGGAGQGWNQGPGGEKMLILVTDSKMQIYGPRRILIAHSLSPEYSLGLSSSLI